MFQMSVLSYQKEEANEKPRCLCIHLFFDIAEEETVGRDKVKQHPQRVPREA